MYVNNTRILDIQENIHEISPFGWMQLIRCPLRHLYAPVSTDLFNVAVETLDKSIYM